MDYTARYPELAALRRLPAGTVVDGELVVLCKIRKKAAFTLGNIGSSDPASLPALIKALQDTDAGVRCEAILAVLKCGPGSGDALPILTELQAKDRDTKVRSYAAKALDKLSKSG